MSRYSKGAEFERKVKRLLESKGFFVIRAAASKPIDLVCIRKGEVIVVECKRDINKARDKVFRELSKLSLELRVKVLLAVRTEGEIVFLDPQTHSIVNIE
ncbi:MAG: hypothetical protein DRP74_09135 [Candidatus Omnitrophota bacterium]|nr:MAG: hypothetical protein DRP74_09135 [Candidatus Omnitrophota bacterium]